MPRFLRQWWLTFAYRYNTIGEMAVMLDNTICHARRCAYDLRHAASAIDPTGPLGRYEYDLYHDRAQMWIKTFAPNGAKEYRSQSLKDAMNLEDRIAELERIVDKAGLPDPNRMPF